MNNVLRVFVAAALVASLSAPSAQAGNKREEAVELVGEAAETIDYFANDSAFEPMWNLADDAHAIVVIPNRWRAAFFLGGAGGDAVMIARNKDGAWSQPTFFAVGAGSLGFQWGVEKSEVVLLVMTQRGMEHLLSTSVKLGADVSIAAGPIGAGAKAQTTDILSFSRSRGVYGGVSLEGAVLKTRRNFNTAYYNADASPAEIIYKGEVYNPSSAALQNTAWRLANKDAPATLAPAMAPATAPTGASYDPYATQPPAPAQPPGQYEDDGAWGAPVKDD
jgi:lipid-binding SYLF domain-containing protein